MDLRVAGIMPAIIAAAAGGSGAQGRGCRGGGEGRRGPGGRGAHPERIGVAGRGRGGRTARIPCAASGGRVRRRRARLARFRASHQVRVEDEEAGLGAVLLDTSVRCEVYRDDVNRDGGGRRRRAGARHVRVRVFGSRGEKQGAGERGRSRGARHPHLSTRGGPVSRQGRRTRRHGGCGMATGKKMTLDLQKTPCLHLHFLKFLF